MRIFSPFIIDGTCLLSLSFFRRAKESLGRCCLVNKNARQVFMRVLMLYGLPRYDDDEEGGQQSHLTTLLMVNMGKMKFPRFDIIRNHSIFRSRDDLIRYAMMGPHCFLMKAYSLRKVLHVPVTFDSTNKSVYI